MRILATLLAKEFKQIFRNSFMIPVIFVIPLVQMILLTYAASLEMKGIRMAVVDQDYSQASRLLVSSFKGSPFFEISFSGNDFEEAKRKLTRDRADVILHLPAGFEERLFREQETDVQLVVNAINATEAGLISAYCTEITSTYNSQIRSEWFGMESSDQLTSLKLND